MWEKAEIDEAALQSQSGVMFKNREKSLQCLELSTGTPDHSLCVEGEMVRGENI